jgi:hypothetical protein
MIGSALRIEESLRRLSSLRDEISEWSQHRRRRDPRGQFSTQLSSLETTLVSALERLELIAAELAPESVAATYEVCRDFDNQLLTVRRLWRWFADKFDQRDNPRYERVLSAADEVVWSVYAGVMRAAHGGRVPASAPLPYLDELSAPEAVPRDELPPELRPGGYDEALRLMLARLPIPVVGLPADIRDEPWELALLGHEVGHHLQYDLLPDRALVDAVGKVVAAAAGDETSGAEWRWWSRELFADLVGLVTVGSASLVVLLPLELGTERHMLDRERDRYPAPAVRLAVIGAMAGELGLAIGDELDTSMGTVGPVWSSRVGDLGQAARAAVSADLARVPKVATALVTHQVTGRRTMAQLSAFSARDFIPGGAVSARARQLAAGQGVAEQGLPVVRNLVSAGVVAWQRVSAMPDTQKQTEALRALGSTLIDRIVGSAEVGTRGTSGAAGVNVVEASVGTDLARLLAQGFAR